MIFASPTSLPYFVAIFGSALSWASFSVVSSLGGSLGGSGGFLFVCVDKLLADCEDSSPAHPSFVSRACFRCGTSLYYAALSREPSSLLLAVAILSRAPSLGEAALTRRRIVIPRAYAVAASPPLLRSAVSLGV